MSAADSSVHLVPDATMIHEIVVYNGSVEAMLRIRRASRASVLLNACSFNWSTPHSRFIAIISIFTGWLELTMRATNRAFIRVTQAAMS